MRINLYLALVFLFGCSSESHFASRNIANRGNAEFISSEKSCAHMASELINIKVQSSSSLPNLGEQTLTTSSGLEVKGKFSSFKTGSNPNDIIYFGTQGPTSLRYEGKVLPGQGVDYHASGFGSPLGLLKNSKKALENLSPKELREMGIEVGSDAVLEFESGVVVKGTLKKITSKNGKNILFTFEENSAEVLGPDGSILFDRSWGIYDMAIGKSFKSTDDNVDHLPISLIQKLSKINGNKEDERLQEIYNKTLNDIEVSTKKLNKEIKQRIK